MVDNGKVFYRFARNSICFELRYEELEEILPRHPKLNKKFLQFKQKTIIQDKVFTLDYIMKLPKHLQSKVPAHEQQKF